MTVPGWNPGVGFASMVQQAREHGDRIQAKAQEAAPVKPDPGCLECKRAASKLENETRRADHLAARAEALEADMRSMSERLVVLEATNTSPIAMSQRVTIQRLQASDLVQRRNIAVAETYLAELQSFIREHCQTEPPALRGAIAWRRGAADRA